MAVTMEALQHLLGEMHKMQSDSLANLMKQAVPSRSKVTS